MPRSSLNPRRVLTVRQFNTGGGGRQGAEYSAASPAPSRPEQMLPLAPGRTALEPEDVEQPVPPVPTSSAAPVPASADDPATPGRCGLRPGPRSRKGEIAAASDRRLRL